MTTLYCRQCWAGFDGKGMVPAICPSCHKLTRWTTMPRADVPVVAWNLSKNDVIVLRALFIDPEC